MKRLFDITASLFLLILLIPLFLIVCLVILIDDGRPVLFKQYRVGKGNKLFYIYKFRSMRNNTRNASTGDLTEAAQQITRSGKILRRFSIDELPQLINILQGKMSFVGPRPLIPEEREIRAIRLKYNVFSVKPGMTGLAQINGRDLLDDEEKAAYDKEYVENQSIILDLKILFKTVIVVLGGKGVVEGSEKQNIR